MKEFLFNDYLCCTNPNVHLIIANKQFEMKIATAYYFDAYWCYGYDWRFLHNNYGFEGGSRAAWIPVYPLQYTIAFNFDTEEDAVSIAKERMYKYFDGRSEWVNKKDPVFAEILKALKAVEKPLQLELF